MSMSINVVGFKPANQKWEEMSEVWNACNFAGVAVPKEVDEFFNGCELDAAGVKVELEGTPCCEVYSPEMKDGFEIDVTKLPKDVTIIRFWNSY